METPGLFSGSFAPPLIRVRFISAASDGVQAQSQLNLGSLSQEKHLLSSTQDFKLWTELNLIKSRT